MAAADLQRQCLDLLQQLKANQATLRQGLGCTAGVSSSVDNNLETQQSDRKPQYARQKLKSIIKNKDGGATGAKGFYPIANPSTEAVASSEADFPKEKPNATAEEKLQSDKNERRKLVQGAKDEHLDTDTLQDYFGSRTTDSFLQGGTDSFSGPTSAEDNTDPHLANKPTTPTSVRRRRIIDRNVHVDSKLSDADLQELERNTRGLNFSYSQTLDGEDRESATQVDKPMEGTNTERKEAEDRTEDSDLTYQKYLVDTGNNRQLNNFIRDTTIKPKTILNSTQSFSSSYSKQGPGVSFQNSSNASSATALFRSQAKERHMLGYDWIAALVSNDTGLMDESESYFQELREFRRSNRDECCNDFYMEGPFTLTQSEPPAVEKAIKETKVQPYTVNDRLFAVPVTENLLGEPLDPGSKDRGKEDPTQDNPRFVRVSIPRATLQMPYKVRPHRRRSFDASDSCSLTDHCLMGWNAVSPATLPTASSVSLTDAMKGINPKHTTTLAEAEKAASTFHWPLLTDPQPQRQRPDPLPTWRKQYMDTTLNLLQPEAMSLSLTSSLDGGQRGRRGARAENVQRRTDQLLSSTYSMMYEMQKARELRQEERRRQCGKMVS
ncbi:uncharacterized protein LOC143287588 [Babylonia areolata]|uniref:uncharacterized protein LOC143287588 n=1 Tax=Babylonia areolata TaxID=304850 RepID=UPI003FD01821